MTQSQFARATTRANVARRSSPPTSPRRATTLFSSTRSRSATTEVRTRAEGVSPQPFLNMVRSHRFENLRESYSYTLRIALDDIPWRLA